MLTPIITGGRYILIYDLNRKQLEENMNFFMITSN
jgi:hypothetical protein